MIFFLALFFLFDFLSSFVAHLIVFLSEGLWLVNVLENLICKEWELNRKAGSGFFPRIFYFPVLLFLFCGICQCVKTARSPANEVPLDMLERSILVDFAAYHRNCLNGKLNGSREETMPGSKWTQHERSSRQRLKRFLARNLHIFAPMDRHFGQCACVFEASLSAIASYIFFFSFEERNLYSHLFTPPLA